MMNKSTRTFSVLTTEAFMNSIGCYILKSPPLDCANGRLSKTDITMQIHDIQTGYKPTCGFSIKSVLGGDPTLLNAAQATNFVFEVRGLTQNDITRINKINTRTKIIDRLKAIFDNTSDFRFTSLNNDVFKNNLMYIDSRFPELMSYVMLYIYRDNLKTCKEVVMKLEHDNPLNIPMNNYYEYKFKEFLCNSALGMTATNKWNIRDDANGGYIIVTKAGDVLAFHFQNRDIFKDYLLGNTRFERPSTKRYKYAKLYNRNGKTFLNLNLQIRFI